MNLSDDFIEHFVQDSTVESKGEHTRSISENDIENIIPEIRSAIGSSLERHDSFHGDIDEFLAKTRKWVWPSAKLLMRSHIPELELVKDEHLYFSVMKSSSDSVLGKSWLLLVPSVSKYEKKKKTCF